VRALILSALVLTTTSNTSLALGWSDWTTVEEIITGNGNSPRIVLADPGDAGTGCNNSDYIRFKDMTVHKGASRSYSTLLAAFMAGKQVKINTTSCDTHYPLFETMKVKP